jgi:RNA polymerase sigma-70 factor (ECF subfamily)
LPEHEGQHEAVALHQPSPHRLAESHQKGEALNRALMSLSENRRRAVTLQLHGFTTPETARLLGWSEAKVRNLAWRGIQDLKQLLRDQGVDS